MTVSKLIEVLQTLPQSAIVVLSSDSEGNSYSHMSNDYSLGEYIGDYAYGGEFRSDEELHEYDEREEPSYRGERAVCLWPVN